MNQSTLDKISLLLGRTPRGLQEVAVSSKEGNPLVLRVSSLVENKPFPTIFWLVDPLLQKKIDQLEATGLIAKLESLIEQNDELATSLKQDHLDYISLRKSYMSAEEKSFLMANNYFDRLQSRGIGGIADFKKVRCLHMHYAFHLVRPTMIGKMIESYLN